MWPKDVDYAKMIDVEWLASVKHEVDRAR